MFPLLKAVIQLSAESFCQGSCTSSRFSGSPSASVVIRRNKKAMGDEIFKKNSPSQRLSGCEAGGACCARGCEIVWGINFSPDPLVSTLHTAAPSHQLRTIEYNSVTAFFQGEAVCTVAFFQSARGVVTAETQKEKDSGVGDREIREAAATSQRSCANTRVACASCSPYCCIEEALFLK